MWKTQRRDDSALQQEAYIHLTSKHHTTRTLANALGVSVATACLALAKMRKEGILIVRVEDGAEWYFDVRDEAASPAIWRNDPLVKLIGFIKGSRRKPR